LIGWPSTARGICVLDVKLNARNIWGPRVVTSGKRVRVGSLAIDGAREISTKREGAADQRARLAAGCASVVACKRTNNLQSLRVSRRHATQRSHEIGDGGHGSRNPLRSV